MLNLRKFFPSYSVANERAVLIFKPNIYSSDRVYIYTTFDSDDAT